MRQVRAKQREEMERIGAHRHAGKLPDEPPLAVAGRRPAPREEPRQQPHRQHQQERKPVGLQRRPQPAMGREGFIDPTVHDVEAQGQSHVIRPGRVGDAGHDQARLGVELPHNLDEMRDAERTCDQHHEDRRAACHEQGGEAGDRAPWQAADGPIQRERKHEHQQAAGNILLAHEAARSPDRSGKNRRDPPASPRPGVQQRVGEQQRQDRHGEPARQDRPSGEIENAGRARPEHPSHQAGDRPAEPQQLLHNDEEADDANHVDEHGAGVETVIAEIYDVGDEVQEKQVAQSVLRLGFEVGHGPEADLFQDAQVNMRVIVVEPCQRTGVTGDHVAQGGNADPAIGEDGDEHGAEQAAGQPAMRNFSDGPRPASRRSKTKRAMAWWKITKATTTR